MKQERSILIAAAVVIIVVSGIWVATWQILRADPTRGTWGDMFGGANALFSGLALAGVVLAILLQRQELLLQRAELELTRREIAGQRVELEAQNRTLQEQLAESSFFQLMRLFRDSFAAIQYTTKTGQLTGLAAAEVLARHLVVSGALRSRGEPRDADAELSAVAVAMSNLSDLGGSDVTAYFTMLQAAADFIEKVPENLRGTYRSILRAQLSGPEHVFILFGGLKPRAQTLKKSVERHGLLAHADLPQEVAHLRTHFEPEAFVIPLLEAV